MFYAYMNSQLHTADRTNKKGIQISTGGKNMEAMIYRLVVVLYCISINFVPIGSGAISN